MDFFNRLLGRPGTAATKKPDANTPQRRLGQFKAVYQTLLKLWRNGQGVSRDAFVAENMRVCIARLGAHLTADSRGPTPHLSISFAFTNGLLKTLTQVATAFCDPGITSEVLDVLQLVVDSEEEAFLEDRGFADALPVFVNAMEKDLIGRSWGAKEEQIEMDREGGIAARIVEVLFGVASAIRSRPLVLKAWFRPDPIYADADELTEAEMPSRLEEFPIFYSLLSHAHSEGRAGDFARMGLLYIVESTSYSSILERWLVEGDMAALTASVLGALYSSLSTRLALTYREDEKPLILKYATQNEKEIPRDVEMTSSPDYSKKITTFMASLMFWQDILEHCASENVKQTLLDHFQLLFLQNLLYPSLLGSSDAEGSAVAVLTYLRNMLESMNHYELVHRMLVYLFGLPVDDKKNEVSPTPIAKARRRKSEALMAKRLGEDDDPTPELFNLRDLIDDGLKSQGQHTITCTLRLLSTLLRRQHQEALPHLLRTRAVNIADKHRTYGGHQKELENWLNMAENLTSFQDLERSFELALYDGKNTLELHACTYPIMHTSISTVAKGETWKPLQPYILLREDAITKSLVTLLDGFLTNDIETNLSLTQVFLDLATCGHMRLEGWLLTLPSKYRYRNEDPKDIEETEDGGTAAVGDTAIADDDSDTQDEKEVAKEEEKAKDVDGVDGEEGEQIDGEEGKEGNEGDEEEEEGGEKDVNGENQEDENLKQASANEAESEETKEEAQSTGNPIRAREEPAWHTEDRSPVFKSLDRLLVKVEAYHRQIQDFDVLLAECKSQISPPPKSPRDLSPAPTRSRNTSRGPTSSPMKVSTSRDSNRSTSGTVPLSTPARGHGRSTSIADRFGSVFGSSPRKTGPEGMAPGSLAANPAARLALRLSEASARPSSSAGGVGQPTGLNTGDLGSSPTSKHRRAGSSQPGTVSPLDETPSKPSHTRNRSLRGDDFAASPTPKMDRRIGPGAARGGVQGSTLRQAIGSDSDEEISPDEDGSEDEDGNARKVEGSVSAESDDDSDGGDDNSSDGGDDGSGGGGGGSGGAGPGMAKKVVGGAGDITVGHLLTNVIILQEFVLEMAALISARATYFGEVAFE